LKSAGLLKASREQNETLSVSVEKLSKEAPNVRAITNRNGFKDIEHQRSIQFPRGQFESLSEGLESLIDFETHDSLAHESFNANNP
jgi:hypothetical protein